MTIPTRFIELYQSIRACEGELLTQQQELLKQVASHPEQKLMQEKVTRIFTQATQTLQKDDQIGKITQNSEKHLRTGEWQQVYTDILELKQLMLETYPALATAQEAAISSTKSSIGKTSLATSITLTTAKTASLAINGKNELKGLMRLPQDLIDHMKKWLPIEEAVRCSNISRHFNKLLLPSRWLTEAERLGFNTAVANKDTSPANDTQPSINWKEKVILFKRGYPREFCAMEKRLTQFSEEISDHDALEKQMESHFKEGHFKVIDQVGFEYEVDAFSGWKFFYMFTGTYGHKTAKLSTTEPIRLFAEMEKLVADDFSTLAPPFLKALSSSTSEKAIPVCRMLIRFGIFGNRLDFWKSFFQLKSLWPQLFQFGLKTFIANRKIPAADKKTILDELMCKLMRELNYQYLEVMAEAGLYPSEALVIEGIRSSLKFSKLFWNEQGIIKYLLKYRDAVLSLNTTLRWINILEKEGFLLIPRLIQDIVRGNYRFPVLEDLLNAQDILRNHWSTLARKDSMTADNCLIALRKTEEIEALQSLSGYQRRVRFKDNWQTIAMDMATKKLQAASAAQWKKAMLAVFDGFNHGNRNFEDNDLLKIWRSFASNTLPSAVKYQISIEVMSTILRKTTNDNQRELCLLFANLFTFGTTTSNTEAFINHFIQPHGFLHHLLDSGGMMATLDRLTNEMESIKKVKWTNEWLNFYSKAKRTAADYIAKK